MTTEWIPLLASVLGAGAPVKARSNWTPRIRECLQQTPLEAYEKARKPTAMLFDLMVITGHIADIDITPAMSALLQQEFSLIRLASLESNHPLILDRMETLLDTIAKGTANGMEYMSEVYASSFLDEFIAGHGALSSAGRAPASNALCLTDRAAGSFERWTVDYSSKGIRHHAWYHGVRLPAAHPDPETMVEADAILPPDVIGAVLEFLPLEAIVRFSETSKGYTRLVRSLPLPTAAPVRARAHRHIACWPHVPVILQPVWLHDLEDIEALRLVGLDIQCGACCPRLLSGSLPGPIQYLWLSDCSHIRDDHLQAIGREARSVSLLRCFGVRSLEGLRGVDTVCLSGCPGIEDTSPLAGSRAVSIQSCYGIRDTHAVDHLGLEVGSSLVTLQSVASIDDLTPFAGLREVNLDYCMALGEEAFALLGKQESLSLAYTGIRRVCHLDRVKHLNLRGCQRVRDISALGYHQISLDIGGIPCIQWWRGCGLQHLQCLTMDRPRTASVHWLDRVPRVILTEPARPPCAWSLYQ